MFQRHVTTPNTGFLDNLAAMTVVAHFGEPAREVLPPDPGTAPIPHGHVRLYHYTPLENAPSIREHGLLFSHARSDAGNGDLTEPSAGVWASTNQPKDILSNHSGHAAVVEFHVHPSEISDYAESPWRAMNKDRSYDPEKLREWNEGHHHVIIKGDVKPDRFVAIHEPWHGAARYMRKSGPLSEYQWVKDDYARGGNDHLEPYVRGLRALEGSVKGGPVSAVAARYEPGLPNPHTGGTEWFHGTHGRPEDFTDGFSYPEHHDHEGEELRERLSHWNTFVGAHFAADHGVAEHFARQGASSGEDEDEYWGEPGSRYQQSEPQSVVHARLHLRNPKVYASEHDMDNEAYEHETGAGNWISKHFEGSYEHEDPEDEDYDPDTPGDGEEWPLTARFRHDDRQPLIGKDEPPIQGPFAASHPGQRRRAQWLASHPDKDNIARRFRERLQAQGHDGILYGNELERDHATGSGPHPGLSAVVFHPHQAEITQHHAVDHPDLSGEEAEMQRRRMPQPGQEELPGFEDHADRFPGGYLDGRRPPVVAHFEAERKPTYWDDLRPRIEAEHARTGAHERTVARMEAVSGPADERYAYSGEGGYSCPSCRHWWEHEAHEDVSDMEPVSWGHLRKYGDPALGEECQYCNDRLTWPRPHTAAECPDISECPSSMADILHGKVTPRHGPTEFIEERWRHNHFDPRTPPHVEGDQPFTPDSTRHRHKWGTSDDWHAELAEHHELAGRERAEREAGHAIDQVFAAPEHDEARRYLEGNGGGSTHLSALEAVVGHFQESPLPEYHGEPLYHGTRSILNPGEHLTVEEAGRYGNNSDLQTDPYVHATTDPREAHRWGERASGAQAQRRMEEAGRGRRGLTGQNADTIYWPRVYEVHPTGAVEPDLEYADTEHDSWRSAHPMRVGREVSPLRCEECPDAGRTVEHWPDHPHYEYLRQQEDEEDEDRLERDAALQVVAAEESHVPSFTWKYQTYGKGPEGGYVDEEREVSGPFYHGSRSKRLQPGSTIRKGMPTNPWGDEGPRSQRVHFTTSLAGARTYARDAGGHVYEVEPTGDVTMGYNGDEWKSEHPLRVIRRVPDDEEGTQVTAAVVAHFEESGEHQPPGHHEFYRGLDREDAQPRLNSLEEHLTGFHAGSGMAVRRGLQEVRDSVPWDHPHHDRQLYTGMDALHRRVHADEDARARSAEEHGAPAGWADHERMLSDTAHHPEWQAEHEERQEHDEAVREHRENGSAHFHGHAVDFADAERHLREDHHFPQEAMPEYELPAYAHGHDPYASALEDAHSQDHGESGDYRHTEPGQYVTMHWGPRDTFDAEHHLVEHHGYNIDELRHDEPDLEAEHERDHAQNRRYLDHHLYTVADPEGHLPQHPNYQGPDAEELREGDPEHHFEVHSRDDEGGEHHGIYHAEDEDHAQEMHEEAHPYDEIHHVGRAPVVPPRRQYTMPAGHPSWEPPMGLPQPPNEHGEDVGTAATWRHVPYAAPPRSREELEGHIRSGHGYSGTGYAGLTPSDVHARMHDTGQPEHQHDYPEGHDPVFGSHPVIAHFGGGAMHDGYGQAQEALRVLGAWDPQGREDAVTTVRELPSVLAAFHDGLMSVSAALAEAPVHAAVRDAVHELAAQAGRAARDADDLVRRLPTEAAWEDSPNR